jgi:hypothetical protein
MPRPYHTNGNYEAFARPRKPMGVDEKSRISWRRPRLAFRGRHARSALVRARAMNAPLLTAELEERHGDLLKA